MDLKFIDRNIVRVQVPSSVPIVQLDGEDSLLKEQDIKVTGSRYTGMLVRPVYSPDEK